MKANVGQLLPGGLSFRAFPDPDIGTAILRQASSFVTKVQWAFSHEKWPRCGIELPGGTGTSCWPASGASAQAQGWHSQPPRSSVLP